MNDLIGHNKPPEMADSVRGLAKELSQWMAEVPTIETPEQAREAKLWNDRAYLCLQDMEDERKVRVAPLNAQVKAVNDYYKAPKEILGGVLCQLKERITSFIKVEAGRRQEAIRVAAAVAEEAQRKLVEAGRNRQAADEEAATGVLGVDAEAHVVAEQNALLNSAKAERAKALAEREARVKIGGGFRRALSEKTYTVIHIDDPIKVLNALGLTIKIEEAMRHGINEYKRKYNKYPDGVSITEEQHI